ncbi:DUF3299 domain-containing protein [Thalassotalea profundi]|uniref:DUF3299 domain-containing protein n=1 Tax=Thalassotalea profundi TaxID=2036687 RepID=A0ABQ3J453_9GAMM|nr:DUF3299 domain-containing protein [Thalassotalea profundi]GHF00693.1 hypothetical protein GCM10011501_32680 [Thalassotalea profundi]
MALCVFGCGKAPEDELTEKQEVSNHQQVVLPVAELLNGQEDEIEKGEAEQEVPHFMTADWLDLIPEDDLDALLNPPSYLDDIVDGSDEDKLINTFKNNTKIKSSDRYEQALVSTNVKAIVNNAPIRIPAFIVPLEFDDEQKVTQFFMVPYYGACIHLPPPPPNQTIFVKYPKGVKLESLYDAYWVSGILKTTLVENETATAAYSMEVYALDLYTEE